MRPKKEERAAAAKTPGAIGRRRQARDTYGTFLVSLLSITDFAPQHHPPYSTRHRCSLNHIEQPAQIRQLTLSSQQDLRPCVTGQIVPSLGAAVSGHWLLTTTALRWHMLGQIGHTFAAPLLDIRTV